MNVDLDACIKSGGGDKRAWDAFVQQTAGVIYSAVQRTMRNRGGHPQETDDRVQDVYVRLLQNDCKLLRMYDSKRASLSTWLSLIARTVTCEQLQKRTLGTVPLSTCDAPSPTPIPVEGPPVPLDVLTERQRLVLQMLFDEGMTVEQAATRIDVDPQTIRSTKHKALCRLREHLF